MPQTPWKQQSPRPRQHPQFHTKKYAMPIS
jgi:hypothetical protein